METQETKLLCTKLFNGLWELYEMGAIFVLWLESNTGLDMRFIILDKCAGHLKQDNYNLYQAFVMAYDALYPKAGNENE